MPIGKYKLENLPRRIQLVIIAGLAIGLVGVAYFFYFKGLLANRSALKTEITQLEAAVAEAAAVERRLSEFKTELATLDARLVELRRILPDQKETPNVLRSVQEMAAESNLKIIKFVPKPVAARDFYSDWPITMQVQGSYNALGIFFEKIGQFTRVVNVDDINIKNLEGSMDPTRTLDSSCTATTFVYREEEAASEPVKSTPPTKNAPKGKGTASGN